MDMDGYGWIWMDMDGCIPVYLDFLAPWKNGRIK